MSDHAHQAKLREAAIGALRQRRPAEAITILKNMATPPAMLMAQGYNMLGDAANEANALHDVLKDDPRHLPALLAMGHNALTQGDERKAISYFRTALAQAMATGAPPQLQPSLQQAQEMIGRLTSRFEDHLSETIAALPRLPRISHATDLLLGRTQLYLQQPSMFYFPGLPQRSFFEREEFDWVTALEAQTDTLVNELEAVLTVGADFTPYVQSAPDRPPPNNHLRDDASWGARYFWNAGDRIAANADLCPATMAALDQVPMPDIPQRSPMALWSLLKPDTHIKPHHGLLNTRLICHLPLLAPPGCALRVGADTRHWSKGEMLIFDDSIEHEAWNRSQQTRVILLFEVWRPEISPDERAALTLLFQAIDSYGPAHVDAG